MTLNQIIEQGYTIDDSGAISDMGKFEGESAYVLHFRDMSTNGFSDDVQYDGDTPIDFYTVDADDVREFPELAGVKRVAVYEDSQGFIHCETDPDDLPEPVETEEDYS
jgi:hypothetical protein